MRFKNPMDSTLGGFLGPKKVKKKSFWFLIFPLGSGVERGSKREGVAKGSKIKKTKTKSHHSTSKHLSIWKNNNPKKKIFIFCRSKKKKRKKTKKKWHKKKKKYFFATVHDGSGHGHPVRISGAATSFDDKFLVKKTKLHCSFVFCFFFCFPQCHRWFQRWSLK